MLRCPTPTGLMEAGSCQGCDAGYYYTGDSRLSSSIFVSSSASMVITHRLSVRRIESPTFARSPGFMRIFRFRFGFLSAVPATANSYSGLRYGFFDVVKISSRHFGNLLLPHEAAFDRAQCRRRSPFAHPANGEVRTPEARCAFNVPPNGPCALAATDGLVNGTESLNSLSKIIFRNLFRFMFMYLTHYIRLVKLGHTRHVAATVAGPNRQ